MYILVVVGHMAHTLARYFDIENEDDLTRIVFGILDLIGPSVLAEVLEMNDGSFSDGVSVSFHTRIDQRANRVPDVLIEDSETTVMIEAKRGTDFDVDQLRDEHEDLQRFGNAEKSLILVTGHESRPSQLDAIELDSVRWFGWRDIALRVSRCDRSPLTDTQTQLIDILRTKLSEEGYMPFTGFSKQFLDELPNIWRLAERYRGNIARFHRDLEGRLGDHNLQAKNMWRDGVSQDFNRFPAELELVPAHVWIVYGEPDSAINSKDEHYLFVAFCVEDGENPVLRVGYSLSPKRYESDRQALIENADEIVGFVRDSSVHLVSTDRYFTVIDRFEEESEMTSTLTGENRLGYIDRLQIIREYGIDRYAEPELTAQVAADLVEFHEFAQSNLDH